MNDTASVTSNRAPTVSLGMPVYNGERFVAEAIRSAQAQTLRDFELVICDNASTDTTEAICRQFAAEDSRIRYYRNRENIGAHPNFNLAFSHAHGRYFKWLAHDDLLQPDYLRECVDVLERDRSVALCQSDLLFIDDAGQAIGVTPWALAGTGSADPVRRFATVLLTPHNCYDFMGVYRREMLALVPLQSFHGGDRYLLAQLSALGSFAHVYRPLMTVRDHAKRYTRSKTKPSERANWTDSRSKSRFTFPHWRLYRGYWGIAGDLFHGSWDKLRATGVLIAWWFFNWNAMRMALDVVATVFPDAVGVAERFKQKYISPAPGIDEVRRKAS